MRALYFFIVVLVIRNTAHGFDARCLNLRRSAEVPTEDPHPLQPIKPHKTRPPPAGLKLFRHVR